MAHYWCLKYLKILSYDCGLVMDKLTNPCIGEYSEITNINISEICSHLSSKTMTKLIDIFPFAFAHQLLFHEMDRWSCKISKRAGEEHKFDTLLPIA